MTGCSSLLKPELCPSFAFCHTMPILIAKTKKVLGLAVRLFGCEPQPVNRFPVILSGALTVVIANAKIHLHFGITFNSGLFEPRKCFVVISLDTAAVPIQVAKVFL